MQSSQIVALQAKMVPNQRLPFLWDYDLNESDVRQLLDDGTLIEKAWLISRILQYAAWDDIWYYLTPNDIQQHFDQLSFRRAQDRALWAYALKRWLTHST